MSFLQNNYNLADVDNMCEAQANLGLRNMAYQCANDVKITGGDICVGKLTLCNYEAPINGMGYYMAARSNGEAFWNYNAFLEEGWATGYQCNIQLSSFSNDLDISENQLIQDIGSRINNLDIYHEYTSNMFSSILDVPVNEYYVMTNSNNFIVGNLISHIYSNNSYSNVCSAHAVYELNLNFERYQETTDNSFSNIIGNTLNPLCNLSDLKNVEEAFIHLKLNETISTSNVYASNLYLTNNLVLETEFSSIGRSELDSFDFLAHSNSKICKLPFQIVCPDNHITHIHTVASERLLVSQKQSSYMYSNINSNIDTNSNIFSNLHYELKSVAKTGDYGDLDNKPESISYFSNDKIYLQMSSNLSEFSTEEQKINVRRNIGLHNIAKTGLLTDSENYIDWESSNIDVMLRKTFDNLHVSDVDNARSKLGLHNMALQEDSNIYITGGSICVENLSLKTEINPTDIVLDVATQKYIVIGQTFESNLIWRNIPNASSNTSGVCKLTINNNFVDDLTVYSSLFASNSLNIAINTLSNSTSNSMNTLADSTSESINTLSNSTNVSITELSGDIVNNTDRFEVFSNLYNYPNRNYGKQLNLHVENDLYYTGPNVHRESASTTWNPGPGSSPLISAISSTDFNADKQHFLVLLNSEGLLGFQESKYIVNKETTSGSYFDAHIFNIGDSWRLVAKDSSLSIEKLVTNPSEPTVEIWEPSHIFS
jgi:hypothetical protein